MAVNVPHEFELLVVDAIKRAGSMPRAQAVRSITDYGVSEADARALLNRLVKQGELTESGDVLSCACSSASPRSTTRQRRTSSKRAPKTKSVVQGSVAQADEGWYRSSQRNPSASASGSGSTQPMTTKTAPAITVYGATNPTEKKNMAGAKKRQPSPASLRGLAKSWRKRGNPEAAKKLEAQAAALEKGGKIPAAAKASPKSAAKKPAKKAARKQTARKAPTKRAAKSTRKTVAAGNTTVVVQAAAAPKAKPRRKAAKKSAAKSAPKKAPKKAARKSAAKRSAKRTRAATVNVTVAAPAGKPARKAAKRGGRKSSGKRAAKSSRKQKISSYEVAKYYVPRTNTTITQRHQTYPRQNPVHRGLMRRPMHGRLGHSAYSRSNPAGNWKNVSIEFGGLALGFLSAQALDRFLATRAGSAKGPWFGVDAIRKIGAPPDLVRTLARLGGGAAFIGLSYWLGNKKGMEKSAYLTAGVGFGMLLNVGLDLWYSKAVPSIFKVQKGDEKTLANRLYPDQQAYIYQNAHNWSLYMDKYGAVVDASGQSLFFSQRDAAPAEDEAFQGAVQKAEAFKLSEGDASLALAVADAAKLIGAGKLEPGGVEGPRARVSTTRPAAVSAPRVARALPAPAQVRFAPAVQPRVAEPVGAVGAAPLANGFMAPPAAAAQVSGGCTDCGQTAAPQGDVGYGRPGPAAWDWADVQNAYEAVKADSPMVEATPAAPAGGYQYATNWQNPAMNRSLAPQMSVSGSRAAAEAELSGLSDD